MADFRDQFHIDLTRLRPILMPGTHTQYGIIGAVCLTGGERYYQLIDADGTVSLMPADVVEPLDQPPS
jgi:hypothetical protein